MDDWHMSYSPDNTWVIQDLDMYPQESRGPGYTTIKREPVMDNCAFTVPNGGVPRSQACSVVPGTYQNHPYSVQYNTGTEGAVYPTPQAQSGEWPSDLENIMLDSSLPTDCDSPLKLEDYNMEFVYVDPSTLDQSNNNNNNNNNNPHSFPSPTCSPHKFPTAAPTAQTTKPSLGCYDRVPFAADTTEMTPAPCLPGGAQDQGRLMGARGRSRSEWRITKKPVGRPRIKTGRVGRPPKDPVIKKEIFDEDFGDDVSEEKKERRREQNRRAARKLREKKKFHVEKMKKDYDGIIQENRRLTIEVRELKKLVDQLTTARDNHVCSCRDVTPSPVSTTSSTGNIVPNFGVLPVHSENDVMTSSPPYGLSHIGPELTQMER